MTETGPDLRELQVLAENIAREAVALIRGVKEGEIEQTGTKSSAADVVTATDQAVEVLIRDRILRARPHDAIIGEEGDDSAGSSGVEWIIDPIDGTVNFVYGIPAFAVSIGIQVVGEPVVGVVINAHTGTEYSAILGGPATRDGQAIRARPPESMDLALVATGFGYDANLRRDQGAAVARLLPQVRDIRRIGSCALDLCGVAEGSVNAYVEEGPHVWDYAAGRVIAEAAGATFDVGVSPRGNPLIHCAPNGIFADFVGLLTTTGFFS